MSFKSISLIAGFNDSNINLKNTGSTLIFTQLSTNGIYFPVRIRVYGTNLSGVTTPPTLSIGTNASSYNNILSSTALTGLVNGTYIDYSPTFPLSPLNGNDKIFVNVTIGAVATTF